MIDSRNLVAAATVAALLACGGGGGSSGDGGPGPNLGAPAPATFQGTWRSVVCLVGNGVSGRNFLTIAPTSYDVTTQVYSGTTCAGSPFTSQATDAGPMGTGSTVSAGFSPSNGTTVAAVQVNFISNTEGTLHDIAYVDTVANPDRLYMGTFASPTPDGRPTTLDAIEYFTKQ